MSDTAAGLLCKNSQAVPGQASANVRDRHQRVTADRHFPRSAVVVRECPQPADQKVAGSSPAYLARPAKKSRDDDAGVEVGGAATLPPGRC